MIPPDFRSQRNPVQEARQKVQRPAAAKDSMIWRNGLHTHPGAAVWTRPHLWQLSHRGGHGIVTPEEEEGRYRHTKTIVCKSRAMSQYCSARWRKGGASNRWSYANANSLPVPVMESEDQYKK